MFGVPFLMQKTLYQIGNVGIAKELTVAPIVSSSNNTWTVDDDLQECPTSDFIKIQDAVDAAASGDTILVYPGTYAENVDIDKRLNIKSNNEPEVTTVSNFYIDSASYVNININGFSIRIVPSYGLAYQTIILLIMVFNLKAVKTISY